MTSTIMARPVTCTTEPENPSEWTILRLTLSRPTMADDSFPLCHRWNCDPSNCPPRATVSAPAPVASGGGLQCDQCGGTFGAAPGPLTAWTCGACKALGL
ncbi:hypothetical protein ACIBL6_47685 [Streptomyces sp. NPDC050400]|uniref:hypothetical protein n=1 Tax=Streptomyces sp. NPDC050400 TaxID=3365610 RepID=UPI0037940ACF